MAQAKVAQRKAGTAVRQKGAPAKEPPKWTHGTFFWNELGTHDVERAKRFYAETLGWSFEAMPMPDRTYWIVKSGDQEMVAGIFDLSGPEYEKVPEHWMGYIAVDDIDARLKKAVAAGATIIRPPFDIPGVGRMAILNEPRGAMIAWMTPAS